MSRDNSVLMKDYLSVRKHGIKKVRIYQDLTNSTDQGSRLLYCCQRNRACELSFDQEKNDGGMSDECWKSRNGRY